MRIINLVLVLSLTSFIYKYSLDILEQSNCTNHKISIKLNTSIDQNIKFQNSPLGFFSLKPIFCPSRVAVMNKLTKDIDYEKSKRK